MLEVEPLLPHESGDLFASVLVDDSVRAESNADAIEKLGIGHEREE
jgi:hypothetical protein